MDQSSNSNYKGDKTQSFFVKVSHFISLLSIAVLLLGLIFLFLKKDDLIGNMYGKGSWHIVYLSDNQVFIGQIKYVAEDVIFLEKAHFLESTKEIISKTSTSSDFSLQPVKEWHTITPISELNKNLLNKDGFLQISLSEVLFWGKLDEKAQIIAVVKKLIGEE